MEKLALLAKVDTALISVRSYLHSDGGDVRVVDIRDDNTLEVELLGNCSTCSMSNMTLRAGIEEAVRNLVPEITRVVAV